MAYIGQTIANKQFDVYDKNEVDDKDALKANIADMNAAFGNKADKATTLAGYGITNAYTKTETDAKDALKANTADMNTAFAGKLGSTATAVNSTKWNGATMYTSTAAASGGVDGDIWFQY